MIATGTTQVTNIEYIERGYENFVEKLLSLWADIQKV
jgi:UDP-N-acetylglucosamine 1-carboxyvinyltransferase